MDFPQIHGLSATKLSRRHFLQVGVFTAALAAAQRSAFASTFACPVEKSVSFYNIHTAESIRAVYWANGEYIYDTLGEINYILRDFRTNEIMPINTRLLDLLYDIRHRIQSRESFHIISGFRSSATNAFLYRNTNGVSKNSLHMSGDAVDIRLPGYELSMLYQAAVNEKGGGVGYYPESDFIHIDVGRVRYW